MRCDLGPNAELKSRVTGDCASCGCFERSDVDDVCSRGQASSMTSAVNRSGEIFCVQGVSIRDLVSMTEGARLCVKIDIEGYEFHLTDQLADIPPDRTAA